MPPAIPSRRATFAAAVLLAIVGIVRIGSTWRVFSQTVDEPIHIAAGFQWLTGRYDLDVEHPPLARLFFGLDAYLEGAKPEMRQDRTAIGNELLYRNDRERHNLAGARAGNLPFFLLALSIVFLWTRRIAGNSAALLATAFFTALPPILGHAGLATTDVPAAATIAAALYAFELWLDDRSWKRTLTLAIAVGAGLCGKFSFLMFFPMGALVLLAGRMFVARTTFRGERARALLQLVCAAAIGFFIVCVLYRFEARRLDELRLRAFPAGTIEHTAARYAQVPGYEWVRADLVERYNRYATRAAELGKNGVDFVDWAKAAGYPSPLAGRNGNTLAGAPPLPPLSARDRLLEPFRRGMHLVELRVPIPAVPFFAGVRYVRYHFGAGHPAFLFGKRSLTGWWYYFPVVVFFKTPLPFLALAVRGLVLLLRRRHPVALIPLAILGASMTSRINIGVRHVLPLYPFLTIAAAVAAVALWRRSRAVTAILLAWYFIGTAIAHPNYLAWFNEAAGQH
nr:glycosyltransferase family 39 protein [Acidobacteriota bacterium]